MRRVKDIAIRVLVVGAVCVGAGRAEESATQSLADPSVFVEELMKQEGLPSLSVAIGRLAFPSGRHPALQLPAFSRRILERQTS